MYGVYIKRNNPFKSPFIAIYPGLEWIQAAIKTCTEETVSIEEIRNTFIATDVWTKVIAGVEVTVTEVDKGIIDICNKPPVMVRTELLGGN